MRMFVVELNCAGVITYVGSSGQGKKIDCPVGVSDISRAMLYAIRKHADDRVKHLKYIVSYCVDMRPEYANYDFTTREVEVHIEVIE